MIPRLQRDIARADLAALDSIIAELPEDDLLGRIGLESRRIEVLELLRRLDTSEEREARTLLLFGGAPVIGSKGIEADFATEALSKYEDLITKVWSLQQHGELARTGPVPARREAALHITNTVHGSFGFELSELQGAPTLGPSTLKEAMGTATQALIAAGKGDAELAEAAEELDARAFGALKEFFAVLKKGRATIRVVAGDADQSFDQQAIETAAERTEASRTEEQNVPVAGTFLGVLPEARRFELRTTLESKVLRGRVAKNLTMAQLLEINAKWASRECVAHVRRVTLTRGGRSHTAHILRAVDAGG